MKAFLYSVLLHWKLNIRNKEILVHYYLVPLIFYLFIGGIFISINPDSYKTMMPAMTVFGTTMGGVLGSPYPLVEFYSSEIKQAYQVGHIPLWTMAAGNFISGLLHLLLMSIVIFITAPLLFHTPMPRDWISYFVSLSILIMANLSIGMVFGLYFKSASKMGMATQLIFLPSIMLSGIMFPVTFLPAFLQQLGRIFPATWGFQLMCKNVLNMSDVLPLLLIAGISILVSIHKLSAIQTRT